MAIILQFDIGCGSDASHADYSEDTRGNNWDILWKLQSKSNGARTEASWSDSSPAYRRGSDCSDGQGQKQVCTVGADEVCREDWLLARGPLASAKLLPR